MTRRRRIGLLSLLAGLTLLGAGAATVRYAGPSLADAAAVDAPYGTPFRLVSDEGQPVTRDDLLGKPTVLFFGFTFCPEVCPTTLGELALHMKDLGPDADRLNYVFVSVDPERDSAAKLHEYLGFFDPRIRGLTGTPDEIAAVAKGYGIYYRRVPIEGGGYTMDHTASMLLIGADGTFRGTIDYHEATAVALAKLQRLANPASA